MFQAMKNRRARKKRIEKLHEYIASVYESEAKGAKTKQEAFDAWQCASSICQLEENELDYLRQEVILEKLKTAPIEVPEDYWYDGGFGYKKVLTSKGEAWVRHELKKVWRADVEFWFKLVLPILALILSIIALVRKH